MIQDLKTGEIYGAILYQDADCVVFSTDGRESVISADQFAEILPTDPAALVAFTRYLPRFDLEAAEPAELRIRRGELARYAAGNGNQILEHRPPPPDPPVWARLLLELRKAGRIPGRGRPEQG